MIYDYETLSELTAAINSGVDRGIAGWDDDITLYRMPGRPVIAVRVAEPEATAHWPAGEIPLLLGEWQGTVELGKKAVWSEADIEAALAVLEEAERVTPVSDEEIRQMAFSMEGMRELSVFFLSSVMCRISGVLMSTYGVSETDIIVLRGGDPDPTHRDRTTGIIGLRLADGERHCSVSSEVNPEGITVIMPDGERVQDCETNVDMTTHRTAAYLLGL